jgi:hypothetical protein
MKNVFLLFICFLFVFTASAQVVTGVYRGKMEVDSPKYTIDFELTLKEKNGKLMGYCHRLFIVEDVLYYNLVKVTARVADSVLIVEDEKSVSNNFKEKTSGVKTVMFFKIQTDQDTVSVMPGEWSTSRTKKFLPITGSIAVRREQNYLATQLYNRLEDKQLAKEMLFEEKTKPVLVAAPVTTTQPEKTDVSVNQPKQQTTQPATNQPANKPSTVPLKDSVTTTTVAATNQQQANTQKTDVVVNPPTQQTTNPVTNKPTTTKDSVKTTTAAVTNQQQANTQKTDVVVNQPKQQTTNPISNKPTTIKDSLKTTTAAVPNQQQLNTQKTDVVVNQPKQQTTNPLTNKPTNSTAKDSVKTTTAAVTNQQQVKTQKTDVVVNPPKQQTTNPVTNKPTTKDSVKNNTAAVTQTGPATATSNKPVTPVVTNPPVQQQTETSITSIGKVDTDEMNNQPVATGKPPVINNPMIIKRTTEIIDALEVTGDSVLLSLYDNGEIDGDTVSVFLNNELVVTKVGLRAQAFKHTIAIKPGEVVQLTLFAENLGSIPPNTGLLVITTNEQRYQVNFSSTLNKSSSIVIRRKE